MDLSNLDVVACANEGSILELLHPVDGTVLTDEKGKKPKAFFIRLLGDDSDKFRSGVRRAFEKNEKSKKTDIDKMLRQSAELLAKCTIDCYFIENKKPVDCTAQEMTRIYLKYPWISEQANEHMKDRSNFTKG